MILTNPIELAKFAEENNWLLVAKANENELEIGDDFLIFLTPQGKRVHIKFHEDGSIEKIS